MGQEWTGMDVSGQERTLLVKIGVDGIMIGKLAVRHLNGVSSSGKPNYRYYAKEGGHNRYGVFDRRNWDGDSTAQRGSVVHTPRRGHPGVSVFRFGHQTG